MHLMQFVVERISSYESEHLCKQKVKGKSLNLLLNIKQKHKQQLFVTVLVKMAGFSAQKDHNQLGNVIWLILLALLYMAYLGIDNLFPFDSRCGIVKKRLRAQRKKNHRWLMLQDMDVFNRINYIENILQKTVQGCICCTMEGLKEDEQGVCLLYWLINRWYVTFPKNDRMSVFLFYNRIGKYGFTLHNHIWDLFLIHILFTSESGIYRHFFTFFMSSIMMFLSIFDEIDQALLANFNQ